MRSKQKMIDKSKSWIKPLGIYQRNKKKFKNFNDYSMTKKPRMSNLAKSMMIFLKSINKLNVKLIISE